MTAKREEREQRETAETTPSPAMLAIYADESCLGNGREGSNPGGAAGVIEYVRSSIACSSSICRKVRAGAATIMMAMGRKRTAAPTR